MKRILVLAVLAVALIATPAMAKEGLYLGVDLSYNNIMGSGNWFEPIDGAGGLGLKVGVNTGSIAVEGELIKSSHNDSTPGFSDGDLTGLSANLRLSFSQTHDPTQAYLLVGLGRYTFEQDDQFGGFNFEFTGTGFNLGGGVEHFFNEQVALNLAAIYRFIKYDDLEINGVSWDPADPLIDGEDGDVFSLNVGLNLYF